MRRSDAIEQLRLIALSLGAEPPSERLIRKWVEQRLLPTATRHGRGQGIGNEWIDAPEALGLGTELIRLNQRGITRITELRVQLFFGNKNSDFEKIRGSLISERERVLKKLYRNKTPPKNYERADAANSPTLSADRIRLGPLADVFKLANLELTDRELVEIASLAFHEFEATEKNSIPARNALTRIFGLNLGDFQLPSFASLLQPQNDDDETPINETISVASNGDLAAAREILWLLKSFFLHFEQFSAFTGLNCTPELKKAFHSGYLALESTPFAVTIFPLCIEFAKCLRSQNPEFPALMSRVIDLAQSMSGLSAADTGAIKPAN